MFSNIDFATSGSLFLYLIWSICVSAIGVTVKLSLTSLTLKSAFVLLIAAYITSFVFIVSS